MKVTRDGATFHKITIELETKQEAKTLWHILNNSGDLHQYWNQQGDRGEIRRYKNHAAALWRALDGVYSPGE